MIFLDRHLASTGGFLSAGAEPTAVDDLVPAFDVSAVEVYRSAAEIPPGNIGFDSSTYSDLDTDTENGMKFRDSNVDTWIQAVQTIQKLFPAEDLLIIFSRI